MKFDISVIIPSIRVQNLLKIQFMLDRAIEPYSHEIIVVSPYDVPIDGVKVIRDFGSPSRCVQMGSCLAEGKLLMWLSDDCTFITPRSLAQCIQLFESGQATEKDGITLRYFEGEGNGEFPLDYWRGKHHGDMQKLAGIPDDYKIAPLGMYNTNYFRELGGLDCRFLHINMNTHDLSFRIQNNGGKIILSHQSCANFYWSWVTTDAKPIQRAYFENDKKLFEEIWDKDQTQRIKIDYYNWTDAESKWNMRFGR